MDEDVKNDMERFLRLAPRPHLGGFYECHDGLINYVKTIVSGGNPESIKKIKITLGMYRKKVLDNYREYPTGFLLDKLKSCFAILDDLLGVKETRNPVKAISLPKEANWSHKQSIIGKIIKLPAGTDTFDIDKIASLRDGFSGIVIYLMKDRPTVSVLVNWPDKSSVIVSAGGGASSEEMNYVHSDSDGLLYVNCIGQDYYNKLSSLNGFVVQIRPHDDILVKVTQSSETFKEAEGQIAYLNETTITMKHPQNHSGIPFSTEPQKSLIDSLDNINKRINENPCDNELEQLVEKLLIMANSDSVEEKYRVGELLSKVICLNNNYIKLIASMSESNNRQVRFTAARCMSKLVEKHPELLPKSAVLKLLEVDITDRSIPNLVIRTIGKGKDNKYIQEIIKHLSKDQKYSNIVEKVHCFTSSPPKNYYE